MPVHVNSTAHTTAKNGKQIRSNYKFLQSFLQVSTNKLKAKCRAISNDKSGKIQKKYTYELRNYETYTSNDKNGKLQSWQNDE